MNPDIKKTLGIINQRIENLERIRGLLLQEFADSAPDASTDSASVPPAGNVPAGTNGNGNSNRKVELKRFLAENGPAKRSEIIAKSGIPAGTVAFLLSKHSVFVRRSDKKWQVDPSDSDAR